MGMGTSLVTWSNEMEQKRGTAKTPLFIKRAQKTPNPSQCCSIKDEQHYEPVGVFIKRERSTHHQKILIG
ncbi:hypothetical protein D3C84_1166500 [compost metagenome]